MGNSLYLFGGCSSFSKSKVLSFSLVVVATMNYLRDCRSHQSSFGSYAPCRRCWCCICCRLQTAAAPEAHGCARRRAPIKGEATRQGWRLNGTTEKPAHAAVSTNENVASSKLLPFTHKNTWTPRLGKVECLYLEKGLPYNCLVLLACVRVCWPISLFIAHDELYRIDQG
jgi:hypothetical protein